MRQVVPSRSDVVDDLQCELSVVDGYVEDPVAHAVVELVVEDHLLGAEEGVGLGEADGRERLGSVERREGERVELLHRRLPGVGGHGVGAAVAGHRRQADVVHQLGSAGRTPRLSSGKLTVEPVRGSA